MSDTEKAQEIENNVQVSIFKIKIKSKRVIKTLTPQIQNKKIIQKMGKKGQFIRGK